MIKRISLFLVISFFLLGSIHSTPTGHYPGTSIGYGPPTGSHNTAYTVNPNGRQSTLSLDMADSDVPSNANADVYVNFDYDTSGKNIFVVYTTDGTAPTKSNGTSVSASFSYYDATPGDRWWLGQLPMISQGTTVKYIIYISDTNLAAGFGRVGFNGYVTSWTEGDDPGFSYVVSAPLPVEFTHFTVAAKGAQTQLDFATASEINNDYFEAQRSSNGRDWEIIGKIEGAGTTQQEQKYSFADRQPLPGMNYYRLRQVDYDGQFEYSSIVSIIMEAVLGEISIHPNPVQDNLQINIPPATTDLIIIDQTGRMIHRQKLSGQADVEIQAQTFLSGTYQLILFDSEGEILTKGTFIKY